ncbi:MAG: glycosyltransferase family 61 protein [Planctomycetota bacterium]
MFARTSARDPITSGAAWCRRAAGGVIRRLRTAPGPERVASAAEVGGTVVTLSSEGKGPWMDSPAPCPADGPFAEPVHESSWVKHLPGRARVGVRIEEGSVLLEEGFVLADRGRILVEEVPTSLSGRVDRLPSRIPRPSRQLRGAVAAVGTWAAHNYYHWMMEGLARIQMIRSAFPDLPADVRWYGPNSQPFHAETLRRAGIEPEAFIDAGRTKRLRAETVYASSAPNFTGWVCGADVEYVRSLFAKELTQAPPPEPGGKLGSERLGGRRLYLSRSDAGDRRPVIDEPNLRPICEKHGFEWITMSGRTVAQQATLFASAEAIVSPHGAALTNLAFCRPRTRVAEIFNPNFWNLCYQTLAERVGIDYRVRFGEGRRPPRKERANVFDPIVIRPEVFDALLDELLNRPRPSVPTAEPPV